MMQERLGCAISNHAHARQILVETLEYAKERKAFGQGIMKELIGRDLGL